MGCESSQLLNHKQIKVDPVPEETISSSSDLDLQFGKFVDRQRGDVLELYHFSRVLSRGAKIVRKVLQRNSRIERICKILPIHKRSTLFKAFQEVEILKNLNHPNVVQILEYFNQHRFLYIMLEDIPGNSLHDLYLANFLLSLDVIVEIIKQILIALLFCHQKGYAHRAINPEHVMILKLENTDNYIVKLVGFGRCLKIGAPIYEKNTPVKDTHFIAPEDEAGNERLIYKQDIWGCGAILLELVSGERKFPDFLQKKSLIIKQSVEKQSFCETYKQIVIDFLNKTLEVDPQKRLDAEQALKHQLFQTSLRESAILHKNTSQVMQKLMHYRVQNNLRSLFAIYGSLNVLTLEEKSEHVMEFYNLDKNKDGKIDFSELVQGFENTFNMEHELAVQNVAKIFQQSNKPQDQYIQFHEYVMATCSIKKDVYQRTIVKIFEELDTNRDGIISPEELGRSIDGVNLTLLMKDSDLTSISLDDFKNIMKSMFEEKKMSCRRRFK